MLCIKLHEVIVGDVMVFLHFASLLNTNIPTKPHNLDGVDKPQLYLTTIL